MAQETILRRAPGRPRRKKALEQQRFEDLTTFTRYGPSYGVLAKWGLLARSEAVHWLDAYDGYRPTEAGAAYFHYEEEYHLIMVRMERKEELQKREQEELMNSIAESFIALPPMERTEMMMMLNDSKATQELGDARMMGTEFKDHEGHMIALSAELLLKMRDRMVENEGYTYGSWIVDEMTAHSSVWAVPLFRVPYLSILPEVLGTPDEVLDVPLPCTLFSRRYVRYYPGLAVFVLVAVVDGVPVRIYDWYGLGYVPTDTNAKEQLDLIHSERAGTRIYRRPGFGERSIK